MGDGGDGDDKKDNDGGYGDDKKDNEGGYGDDKDDFVALSCIVKDEGGYGDDKEDEGRYGGRAGKGGYGETRRTKRKHRKKKCDRKNRRREKSYRKRRVHNPNPRPYGGHGGYDQCPPKERKCRPRTYSASSCSSISSCSSSSSSSSCLSSGSSSGVRTQVFCEARTIGQLYEERIASLKLKEEKYKKKLRVVKSQLKVQYRERHEFFQELRGFTHCQMKQLEEYDCASDSSSSSGDDCEPQCKPKRNLKCKSKCKPRRRGPRPFQPLA